MKTGQQNRWIRFLLRVVDVLVSVYVRRPVHWEKPPFQKATPQQKRTGGFFMALFPILFLAGMGNQHSFDAALNSMMYGTHSILWLYLGAFIVVGGFGGIFYMVGPKTPLSLSVPIALVMWPILGWFCWTHLIRT